MRFLGVAGVLIGLGVMGFAIFGMENSLPSSDGFGQIMNLSLMEAQLFMFMSGGFMFVSAVVVWVGDLILERLPEP